MDILIVYASNSGNTLLVTERVADRLRAARHRVTVQDVVATQPADLRRYPVVVFGSCTWEQLRDGQRLQSQLPSQFQRFADQLRELTLPDTQFAVFGLGRHEYTGFCGAANHLQVVVNQLGGKLVVPVLKIDGFPHHQTALVDQWADQVVGSLTTTRHPASLKPRA